ncbi:MAG: hypothetical protein OJI67_17205, partial [Prosthecobacter sp.]|nr:hypothetical protein [Prosthecobacter sp.]
GLGVFVVGLFLDFYPAWVLGFCHDPSPDSTPPSPFLKHTLEMQSRTASETNPTFYPHYLSLFSAETLFSESSASNSS